MSKLPIVSSNDMHNDITLTSEGVDERGKGPSTYVVSFPKIIQSVRCPVPGCPARAHSARRLREHFMFRHFRSQIAVVQEGRETLPRCDMCGMHMSAGRIIKHRQTARCDRNTQMRWRRRDVEIVAKCTEATFSLTGDDGAECFVGVYSFKYLGRILHQEENDWLAVLRNIQRARQVWGWLGKLLRQEGADPILSAKFYRAVVQAVLLFGADTSVLSAAMLKNLEGVHVGFLRQVTGMKARRLGEKNWTKEGPDRVLQAAGTKSLREYIDKRQATVAEWVALRPIFEVCAKETGYEGGGKLREPWWR